MIMVTRLNKTTFYLNALLVETVEATPDTVITLTNSKKYVVKESVAEVIDSIEKYYRTVSVIKYFSHNESGGSHVPE